MRKILYLLTAAAAVLGLGLAAVPAGAGISGSRATNANVNPVAGYIAVGNGPNVNFDHVTTYAGAQQNIGDLALGLGNGSGVGLCQTNTLGSTGPAVQTGIVQVSPGVYQMAYGAGITTPGTGASTNGDNCENGALGNSIQGSVTFAGSGCPANDGLSGTYANKNTLIPEHVLICTFGPTFAFGQVMEQEAYYRHGKAEFAFRNITGDNPGPWFQTPWFSVTAYIGSGVEFNEAVTGVDADAIGLVGPATHPLAPYAHASVSSFRHDDSGYFDTAPHGEWTAVPVSSYPNGNIGDPSVLAPTPMHHGNYAITEGSVVS